MTRQIVVDIVGDSSKFEKSTDAAVKSGGRFGKQAAKGFGLGVGLGVFSLATGAVDAFIGSLGEMQQAYKDDQVSQAKLDTALRNNVKGWDGSTKAIEDYASAQQRLGFQDDEIRDSIGQLIGITHDQEEATRLNTLAQDLARAKGLDLATATDIVTKAAQGNGKALKGLGIDIGDAKTATELLDAAQRNVTGSAEAWAATSEGKAAVANARNAESMEKIGAVVDRVATAVLPLAAAAFEVVADVVLGVADAIEPVVKSLVKELAPAFKTVVTFLTGTLFPAIQRGVTVVLPPLRVAIGVLGDVFRTVFGVIATVVKTQIGIVSGVISAVVTVIKGITGAINTVATGVGTAIGKVVGFFSGLPGRISKAIGGLFDGIPRAFRAALNAVVRAWNNLKFTIGPVDLGPLGKVGPWTIGTPNLPYFHKGGVVPGAAGSDVPIMAQAGETIIPADGRGRSVVVNIYGPVYGDSIDELTRTIAARLLVAG